MKKLTVAGLWVVFAVRLALMSTKAAGKFIRKETIWALPERILESNLSLSYMILELIYFSEIS